MPPPRGGDVIGFLILDVRNPKSKMAGGLLKLCARCRWRGSGGLSYSFSFKRLLRVHAAATASGFLSRCRRGLLPRFGSCLQGGCRRLAAAIADAAWVSFARASMPWSAGNPCLARRPTADEEQAANRTGVSANRSGARNQVMAQASSPARPVRREEGRSRRRCCPDQSRRSKNHADLDLTNVCTSRIIYVIDAGEPLWPIPPQRRRRR